MYTFTALTKLVDKAKASLGILFSRTELQGLLMKFLLSLRLLDNFSAGKDQGNAEIDLSSFCFLL